MSCPLFIYIVGFCLLKLCLEVFICVHEGYRSVAFFPCSIFGWLSYQGNADLTEWVGKYSLLYNFLEELVLNQLYLFLKYLVVKPSWPGVLFVGRFWSADSGYFMGIGWVTVPHLLEGAFAVFLSRNLFVSSKLSDILAKTVYNSLVLSFLYSLTLGLSPLSFLIPVICLFFFSFPDQSG